MMLLLNVLARLIAEELLAFGRTLAKWIIIKSAECLPGEEQDRRREELLAHLNEVDSVVLRLVHALSFALKVKAIAAELRGEKTTRLKFLRRGKKRLFSFSRIAKGAASIAAIVSVLIRIPPGPAFIESLYAPAADPHMKIEGKISNSSAESKPPAQLTRAARSSKTGGGAALLPNPAEGVTHIGQQVNRGMPWDASINSAFGTSSQFINSDAFLAGGPLVKNGLSLSPDIAALEATASGIRPSLNNGVSLLANSLSPLNGGSTLNAAPYLNGAVLAGASPPVLNTSALFGGDPGVLAPQAYLTTGIRPWSPASDIGAVSPQFAVGIPMPNNNGLLGTSAAAINATELAGGSRFLTRALMQLNEVSGVQQASLTPNYLIAAEGRYPTSPATDRSYLNPAALTNGITPSALARNQAVSVSGGVSIVEPAFLAGTVDAGRPLMVDLNAATSQSSLRSGMSPCATVGWSEPLGRIAPSCNPAVALPQPTIGINPQSLGGYNCTGL